MSCAEPACISVRTSRLSPNTIRFIPPRSAPNTNVPLVSACRACIFFCGLISGSCMSSNKLIYAMLSHRGRVRHGNEDACAASPEAGVFVVCDGMGGAAAGEIASQLAAETFVAYLAPDGGQPSAKPQVRLCAAINAANQAVYRQSRNSSQLA